MLASAERETLISLRLNPSQPDARNLLGVIYAEQGRTAKALLVWSELLREAPDYQPARTNLSLLGSQTVASGGTAAVLLTAAVPQRMQTRRAVAQTERPLKKTGRQK